MSYYDFDDHFWMPKNVCIQSKSTDDSKIDSQRQTSNPLFVIFASISIGLLITILFGDSNHDLININQLGNNCLMFKGKSELQIYCSKAE